MLNRTMAPLVLAVLLPVALAAPKEVSRPRDPEEGGGLRRGLGLQVGSFVWTAGVSPRPPAAELARRKGPGPEASPAAWQQTAEGDEQEEAGGEVVTIQLSPAVGEGPALGLGPQLGAKVSPEGQAEAGAASGGAQEAEDAGEAAVSMPMSEQDVIGRGRTLALGPQMSARVSPGAKIEAVPVWYAYVLESVSQSNGRFFQLCLLVNVFLLVTAFYCNPIKRRSKQVR
mmetsp:Transcript_85551/g.223195  ORF Transcript_85551/g.223195 Transcript_85551/m.223195 type:complete len:228 (+) Transcript_85551:105-788(+)